MSVVALVIAPDCNYCWRKWQHIQVDKQTIETSVQMNVGYNDLAEAMLFVYTTTNGKSNYGEKFSKAHEEEVKHN